MTNIKTDNLIEIELFNTCVINNTIKSKIIEMYPTRKHGAYYLDKFSNFLKDNYNISLKEYCKNYLNINWPKCPISGDEVGYKINGKGINLSKFKKGKISKELCPNFAIACERFSKERMGNKNPMYGKTAWNKGLDRTNAIINALALKREGSKMSEESKLKMRQKRAESPLKARHTQPHSKEQIEKMRKRTAKMWAEGIFNRTTSIHIKMRELLLSLNLVEKFVEEYQVKYFSLDFAFPSAKIGIECDGDYYHCNPIFYPNGPTNTMQRRNFGRDKVKDIFLKKNGWRVLRFWECEINSEIFKEKIICSLKELNLLKN